MLRIAILGSTGSIGTQTLDVARLHPESIQVVGLAAHRNGNKLAEQAAEFKPKQIALFDESAEWEGRIDRGMEGLLQMVNSPDVDLVVICVSGMIGLQPTIAAIEAKKSIALASKEVLVAGGAVVMPMVKSQGVRFLPIDSEHSAILQCILGAGENKIERLFLTASGGPFRGWSLERLESVTPEMALNHPTWRMGGKITIDSATLMNKGLEIIEACWLYDQPPSNVDVVVHPQSVIHSMVKFEDGSVLGQMGHPDMKLPIQFALFGKHLSPTPAKFWEPLQTQELTFESYDQEVFICPSLARQAFEAGGVVPAFLNAVNEEAANAFLRSEIPFPQIQTACLESLSEAPNWEPTLENILEADKTAREWFSEQR